MLIRYFAMLREVTGQSEQVWTRPVSTVGKLLQELGAVYGPGFQKWVRDEHGNLGGLSIVLVNGADYRELGGLDTPLKEGDTISIFPPVAGG